MDNQKLIALAAMYTLSLKSAEKPKREWTKKWKLDRNLYGHMPLLKDLKENYPEDFRNYLRMDDETFQALLSKVENKISKQDTVMRKSISAEERLCATLRFLATGRSFKDLEFSTGMAPSTLCNVIPDSCEAIYEALRGEYMKFPTTKEEWFEIAKNFEERWQFINCGGALDGKHIRIKAPAHSGAHYYNYKNFYSIILMAMVNSNYEFIFVDVGRNGRVSDAGVIANSAFYQKMNEGQLNLPTNLETKANLNYTFIGDEAFSLHKNFLKPFAQSGLNYEKRIFNYRLSRARNVTENCFGQVTARFRIFDTPINMQPQKIIKIILAICVLHNFLKRSSKFRGKIQAEKKAKAGAILIGLQPENNENIDLTAKESREAYMKYFNSNEGKVGWQNLMVQNGRA